MPSDTLSKHCNTASKTRCSLFLFEKVVPVPLLHAFPFMLKKVHLSFSTWLTILKHALSYLTYLWIFFFIMNCHAVGTKMYWYMHFCTVCKRRILMSPPMPTLGKRNYEWYSLWIQMANHQLLKVQLDDLILYLITHKLHSFGLKLDFDLS